MMRNMEACRASPLEENMCKKREKKGIIIYLKNRRDEILPETSTNTKTAYLIDKKN